MVIPPFESSNFFEVEKNSHPVLFVQINPLSSLINPSRRKEADNEMRRRLEDYGPTSLYPVLHGISVFGTKMCHLQYTRATGLIEPDHGVVDDEDQWSEDILQANGAELFSAITNDVFDMCSHMDPS